MATHPGNAAALKHMASNYLRTSGWLASVEQGAAVDADGPVPWFTYAATRYLSRIVRPGYRVLEFGAGNSTRWWSARVAEVVSVEHDPNWVEPLRASALANVTLVERNPADAVAPHLLSLIAREYFPLGLSPRESPDPTRNYRAGLADYLFLSYASVPFDYAQGYFDVIVVDGMARVLTTWAAAMQLAPHGMIVFDNSDRDEYQDAYRLLEQCGFARIDFSGPGPLNAYEWCTSVFVRSLAPLRQDGPT